MTKQAGEEAYQLQLQEELSRNQNVFHASKLWKFILDPSYVIKQEHSLLQENWTYEEQLVEIPDHKERQLPKKVISLLKVL